MHEQRGVGVAPRCSCLVAINPALSWMGSLLEYHPVGVMAARCASRRLYWRGRTRLRVASLRREAGMPMEIKRLAVVAVATVGAFSSASLVLAGSAAAALPPGCSAASGTVTCTFSFTGAAQSFRTVPSGVNSITVAGFGAQGGGGAGGRGGAEAVFAVLPGAAVEVLVGGQGATSTGAQTGAAGGLNGGGAGGDGGPGPVGPGPGSGPGGSGGGGASDVRTGTCASSLSCGLAARVLVGSGGGGVSASAAGGGGSRSPPPGVQEPPSRLVVAAVVAVARAPAGVAVPAGATSRVALPEPARTAG